MASAINRVTNANIYIDGESHLGKGLEVELPSIEQVTAEHKGLGQVGIAEYFAGFAKMEATIKWAAIYSDIYSLTANPFAVRQLQIRANIDVITSQGVEEQVPYVAYVNGSFKKMDGGTFKQQENVELESMMTVNSFKIEIGGEEKVEFDVLANIYKVDGVDQLAQYRANLGIA